MLIGWKHIAALLAAVVLAGFLIGWSGVIGVRASTGHWKVTDWFLHWVMRSSVRTAALATEVPVFTEAMLPMAAGHFEAGCAVCHGSPAMPPPAGTRNMLPPPPDLNGQIARWSDAQLFEIVQHGVRYTGMPAWPVASREDEVWAMVAFLRRYPVLDTEGYRALTGFAASRTVATEGVIETCNGCHAPDRLGAESLIPRLAGQSELYLEQALAAYANGMRASGVMAVATEELTAAERQSLARHFAGQPAPGAQPASDEALVKRGEMLALKGDPDRRIPSCLSCHDKAGVNPAYPRLSGQPAAYLANQLRLFAGGVRGGGPFREVMTRVAANLEEDDRAALAAYFSAR